MASTQVKDIKERCLADLHKYDLATSDLCAGDQLQTMNHIVDLCPLTKLEGGLQSLHDAGNVQFAG